MAPLLENMATLLLPQLEGVTSHEKWLQCSKDYPWYPVSWLMLASEGNPEFVQKAALWFTDDLRLQWLLHSLPLQREGWVAEQLKQLESVQKTADAKPGVSLSQSKELSLTEPADEPVIETGNLIPEQEPVEQEELSEPAQKIESLEVVNEEPPIVSTLKEMTTTTKGEPMLFEPYHAVDYFASQGIKLNLAGLPQDKLEKQLKSFTQWLKTMKKVADPAAAYADPMVEAQAVESNNGKEVLTEAMALVLEKQDKFEKAIAIYEKLILLHPEKGALFAARIEDLKKKK